MRTFICSVLAPVLLSACASTTSQSQRVDAPLSPPSIQAEINQAITVAAGRTPIVAATDYRLGPQDSVEITLFNVPSDEQGVTPRTTTMRISQEGKIVLPLLGVIPVAGLTTTDLESELRSRYKTYLQDPQVGVLVKEFHSQRVSIIGAVQRPGMYELTGPKTLLDLLAQAGGVNDRASHYVHLLRSAQSEAQRHVIDLRELVRGSSRLNVAVQANDVVEVPRAGTFFVDGAVTKPGAYPLERPYTLTQALATAGGLNHKEAKLEDVMIFRHRDFMPPESILVRVPEVLAGTAPDPPVEANDVLFVPTSMPKVLVNRLINALGMGLSVPLR